MIKYKAKTEVELLDISNIEGPISSRWEVSIGKASYDWIRNTASIELICQEDNSKFKHSRSFDIPADGEVTSKDIEQYVTEYLGKNYELLV